MPAPQETVAEPSVIHAKSTENQEKSAVAPVVIKPTAIPVEPKSDAEAPIAAVTEPKSGIVPVSNIGSTLFADGPPPMTEEEMTRRESRKQFLSWIAPGVILLLLASGTTTYLLISRQSKPQPAPTVQASAPAVLPQPLHLDVELQANGQINVRWNSSADKVANAREGRLVVTEEDQAERVMPLNKAQLAIGHFSYQPSRERIEFRLEVLDMNGSVTQESVLAMSPKVAAAEVTKPAEIITGGASAAKNSATPTAA